MLYRYGFGLAGISVCSDGRTDGWTVGRSYTVRTAGLFHPTLGIELDRIDMLVVGTTYWMEYIYLVSARFSLYSIGAQFDALERNGMAYKAIPLAMCMWVCRVLCPFRSSFRRFASGTNPYIIIKIHNFISEIVCSMQSGLVCEEGMRRRVGETERWLWIVSAMAIAVVLGFGLRDSTTYLFRFFSWGTIVPERWRCSIH